MRRDRGTATYREIDRHTDRERQREEERQIKRGRGGKEKEIANPRHRRVVSSAECSGMFAGELPTSFPTQLRVCFLLAFLSLSKLTINRILCNNALILRQ